MAAPKRNSPNQNESRLPPATTPQAQENRLIAMAMDLAEQQIRDGSVSPGVLTHVLKLATEREKTERDILKRQAILLEEKTKQIKNSALNEEIVKEAVAALRGYQGDAPELDDGAIF